MRAADGRGEHDGAGDAHGEYAHVASAEPGRGEIGDDGVAVGRGHDLAECPYHDGEGELPEGHG